MVLESLIVKVVVKGIWARTCDDKWYLLYEIVPYSTATQMVGLGGGGGVGRFYLHIK